MTARDQTEAMLAWWAAASIDRADLAMRRRDGAMLWCRDRELDRLPLAWAGRENADGAEIYVRPARGHDWPIVFLDDLALARACRAAERFAALVVSTSPVGGCHLWLRVARPLDERQRYACQRHLAERTGADLASTSGEHLGRLAGFRNHKRQGPWVNVVAAASGPSWMPPASLIMRTASCTAPTATGRRRSCAVDRSPSGSDWAFTRAACERGDSPALILARLVERCRERRGADAERYARRTLERALHLR